MHCNDFENRLNDLLDRRMTPDDDAALCAHARRCSSCADAMSAYTSLTTAIQSLSSIQGLSRESPEETFPFAVMNRFEESQHVLHRTRNWQWLATSLVTAATVLVAVALWRGGVNANLPAAAPGNASGEQLLGYERLAEETQQLASLFATRQLEVINDLAEGIKPVATSFGAAYDAVLRTLPAGNTAPTATSG